jgi:hypothetical protein
MKVKPILNEFLNNASPFKHKARHNSFADAVLSVLDRNELTVTALGRGVDRDTSPKDKIKRVDRLLSNRELWAETNAMYATICKRWIPHNARPVILVDWSNLDERGNAYLISATLSYDGRPITLYQEVHAIETKEKPAAHKKFLTALKGLLPEGCRPIVVADAGFKVPWHKLVLSLGWDYVGRVRKPNHYSLNGEDWRPVKELFEKANSRTPLFKGKLTKNNPFDTPFILHRKPAKGRHKFTAKGKVCQSTDSKKHADGGREPWLLVTSLDITNRDAKRIVQLYAKRMEIECGYRDMKSEHYGLGFNASKSYKINRINILMLISAVAALILIIIGTAVEQAGVHYRYQANTIKHRRVLSLHFLGREVIKDSRMTLLFEDLAKAIEYMKKIISKIDRSLWSGEGSATDKYQPSLAALENNMFQ